MNFIDVVSVPVNDVSAGQHSEQRSSCKNTALQINMTENLEPMLRCAVNSQSMHQTIELGLEKQSLFTNVGDSFVLYVNLIRIYKMETNCL